MRGFQMSEPKKDENAKKEETPANDGGLMLHWNGDGFDVVTEKTEGVILQFFPSKDVWIFSYSEGTPLITRRTALRRANEIARMGFVDPKTGGKVGINCKCEEEKDPYHALPKILVSDEHEYNKNK